MIRALALAAVMLLSAGCARERSLPLATPPPRPVPGKRVVPSGPPLEPTRLAPDPNPPAPSRRPEAATPVIFSVWENVQRDASGQIIIRLTLMSDNAFRLETIVQAADAPNASMTLAQDGTVSWSGTVMFMQTRSFRLNGLEAPAPSSRDVPQRCYLEGNVMRVVRGHSSLPLYRTR